MQKTRTSSRTLIVGYPHFFLTIVFTVTEDELQKLYKNFSKLDKDKNGTLEPEEFFDIPGKL